MGKYKVGDKVTVVKDGISGSETKRGLLYYVYSLTRTGRVEELTSVKGKQQPIMAISEDYLIPWDEYINNRATLKFKVREITTLPLNSQERKSYPLYEGLLKYFPAALSKVAWVSKIGNDKHNPGQPMHHARGKSGDHADCILRHLVDMEENKGVDEHNIPQVAYIAWRALALCQEWLEANENAPLAPGAKES